ncbi:lysine-arginine-ornithine-binding periplasmic protein precursor [Vibrio ponticus]|nr:lysine-arginine-ornithine-binding periplasmic protein precursor [Vibrio ponticus]
MKKWLVVAALAATTVTGMAQAKEWKTVRFGIEGAYLRLAGQKQTALLRL